MITVEQARHLKPNDVIAVTTTHQEWFVDHVELQGVMPFVHIWRGTDPEKIQRSVIRPERLNLFEIPLVSNSNDQIGGLDYQKLRENLTDNLQETVNASTVDLTEEESEHISRRIKEYLSEPITDENGIEQKLEDKFLKAPELQKPATKKTTTSKAKAKK